MEVVGCLVSLGQDQCGHARLAQEKLDENCVYLGSCSSFQQVFTKNYLFDVKTTMMRLKGDCNTINAYSKCKCWWQGFHMWLEESGIANLLSVPQLEADGFTINYNTERNWVVTTPEGEEIVHR